MPRWQDIPLADPAIGCRISNLAGCCTPSQSCHSRRRKVAKQKLGPKLVTNTEAHLVNTLFRRTSVDDQQLAGPHSKAMLHVVVVAFIGTCLSHAQRRSNPAILQYSELHREHMAKKWIS